MTDGAMLTEILAALEIPCDKFSFHGKLDALAAGLGIDTEGRLLGDVLDDIAAKEGIQRDNRLYGAFIRKLYDYITNGEDVTLEGNPLVLANSVGRPLKECVVSWEPTQEGSGEPYPPGGGKNKLPFPSNSTAYPQNRNGLTVTANADGSYTVNGTATTDTWFNVCTLYGNGFDDFGAFALSGCPRGGSTSTSYYLALYTGTKWYSDIGAGGTGQIDTIAVGARIEISIRAGYTATNLRFWPQLEHGSTVTAYAPYSNIRPIHGRTEISVERCGENLLNIAPFTKLTKSGVTYEYVANGGVRISGAATANVDSPTFAIGHLPPGKYYGLDMGTGIAASIVVQRKGSNGYLWLNAKGIFEIMAGDVIKYWYMIANNGVTLDKTVYPYIVPSTSTPAEYAPYAGETKTLALPEEIYGADLQADGVGQETWKLLTLTGEEEWGIRDTYIGAYNLLLPTDNGKAICTDFTVKNNYAGENLIVSIAGTVYLARALTDKYTVDTWKSYLATQNAAGTPVQVAYKLATPVPFTATGGGTIPTVKGTNTLLTDADTIKATYRCNVRAAEQELDTLYADLLQELEE